MELQVLYRVDIDPKTKATTLLVQSGTEPDYSTLPRGYLIPGEKSAACTPMDKLFATVTTGMQYRFKLRANPTRKLGKTKKDDHLAGKRVAILSNEGKLSWLAKKGTDWGFKVLAVSAKPDYIDDPPVPNVLARPAGNARGHKKDAILFLTGVMFEGRLEVTNPGDFCNGVKNGIGTGKAHGFGLLSFFPAP